MPELLSKSKPSMLQRRSSTETSVPVQPAPREITKKGPAKLDIFLLSCGIAAPLLYAFTDVLLAIRWEDYSFRDQTISELNAIGAPTRTLSIILGIVGYAFLVAFGVGVWRSAVADRRLRAAGHARWPDRGLGVGGQVDDGAAVAAAAHPVVAAAPGGAGDHRRVPVAERGTGAARLTKIRD